MTRTARLAYEDGKVWQASWSNFRLTKGDYMSVVDDNTVDGIALTDDNEGIVLLLSDHLDWDDEYNHLLILQEKLNAYIYFLEEKQYEEIYSNANIVYGIIDIHFLHKITKNIKKFLKSVQVQLEELGITMQYSITEENKNETR